MLAQCAARAGRKGLHPRLYRQAMHALDLPQKYKTIYICGSFGLAGSRAYNQETLRRCRRHLVDGGALVFNVDAEYSSPDSWMFWLKDRRQKLPEPWPEDGDVRRTPGGAEFVSRFRLLEIDPLEQSYVRQVRLEKWRDGRLLDSQEHTLRGYMVFKNEVELMLQLAGFTDISVQSAYSGRAATADDDELVFIAVK
jgi:hypothetical protein